MDARVARVPGHCGEKRPSSPCCRQEGFIGGCHEFTVYLTGIETAQRKYMNWALSVKDN